MRLFQSRVPQRDRRVRAWQPSCRGRRAGRGHTLVAPALQRPGLIRSKQDAPDVESTAQPDPACDLAICVRPLDGGRQGWELIDAVGARVMHGTAVDQTSALAMAQFAAQAVGALRRIRRDDRIRVRAASPAPGPG